MARSLAYVANANAASGSEDVPLDQIPEEIRQEVEEAYAALKSNPNGRLRATFDTEAELNEYVRQVRSYCAQRPAGVVRFRKSPTRKLPSNVMDFRITDAKDDDTPEETVTPVTVAASGRKR